MKILFSQSHFAYSGWGKNGFKDYLPLWICRMAANTCIKSKIQSFFLKCLYILIRSRHDNMYKYNIQLQTNKQRNKTRYFSLRPWEDSISGSHSGMRKKCKLKPL